MHLALVQVLQIQKSMTSNSSRMKINLATIVGCAKGYDRSILLSAIKSQTCGALSIR